MGAAVGAAAAAWLAASTTPRLFRWVACPVVATALVCGSVYSWLRLPFWLGWLASELITRLAMHGYPLRLRSLRLRPWLELRPLERRRSATLHLDLFVTHFYLANPPGCKAPHFVSADEVNPSPNPHANPSHSPNPSPSPSPSPNTRCTRWPRSSSASSSGAARSASASAGPCASTSARSRCAGSCSTS